MSPVAIAGLALVLVAVAIAMALRSKGGRAQPPQVEPPNRGASRPPLAPPPPDADDGPPRTVPSAGHAAVHGKAFDPADIDGATAPAPELKMVSCTVDNGVHGAMPPFGRLRAIDTGLVFEATSRVMAATGEGFATGEGATTMQSVGSVEMGKYRFDVARAEVRSVVAEGKRVTVKTTGKTYLFEGIGPTAKQIVPWLHDHGYDH